MCWQLLQEAESVRVWMEQHRGNVGISALQTVVIVHVSLVRSWLMLSSPVFCVCQLGNYVYNVCFPAAVRLYVCGRFLQIATLMGPQPAKPHNVPAFV